MPDWCDVNIRIEGEPEEIIKFEGYFKTVRGVLTVLNQILPPPEAEVGNIAWYEENWGTKNDYYFTIEYSSDTELELRGITAWHPPITAFEKISKMFPSFEIDIDHHVPGNTYHGYERIGK